MDQSIQTGEDDLFCARIAQWSADFLKTGLTSADFEYAVHRAGRGTETPQAARLEWEQFIKVFQLAAERAEMLRRVHDFALFEGGFCDAHRVRLNELLSLLASARATPNSETLQELHGRAVELLEEMGDQARQALFVRASGGTKFTLLHFTDLHWDERSHLGAWPRVETDFFHSFQDVRTTCGNVDLVIFSGDLVRTGREAEFDALNALFERLWPHIPGNPPLLSVAGNHDLKRPETTDQALVARLTSYAQRDEVRKSFWKDTNGEDHRVIGGAFANYCSWQSNNLRHQCWEKKLREGHHHAGLLPGDFSYWLEKEGRRLGIVGLSSAFLQLKDGLVEGELALDACQLYRCFEPPSSEPLHQNDANFLVTHHPRSWLCPHAQKELDQDILRPELFLAHLCGHLHEAAYSGDTNQPGLMRHRLQGPALFSQEPYLDAQQQTRDRVVHGYHVIEVYVHDDTVSARVWPRILTQGRWWTEDHEHFRLEGRWSKFWSLRNVRRRIS